MAERRMISKKIADSDAFMDMPLSTQALYFHLLSRADDDGFVGNPKKIMRMIGASEDEYKLLIVKRFILVFESGVCVIKHWLVHNLIRADLYKETQYKKEKQTLGLNENGGYTEMRKGVSEIKNIEAPEWLKKRRKDGEKELRTACVPLSAPRIGKVRLGKVRLERDAFAVAPTLVIEEFDEVVEKKEIKKFIQPTLEEVKEYCLERKSIVNPEKFINHYDSNGWKIGGKGAMKDWKACVRTWETNNFGSGRAATVPANVLITPHTRELAEIMQKRANQNK